MKIKNLDTEKVPNAIKLKIENMGGKITQFTIVKTLNGVPKHDHLKKDGIGEMYFGGENGEVVLYDSKDKEIDRKSLSENNYTIVMPGGGHEVISTNENGETYFFAVKFEIEEKTNS